MRSVKDKGLEEIKNLKNRVARSYGAGRISKKDSDELFELIESLEGKIKDMEEKHEEGGE